MPVLNKLIHAGVAIMVLALLAATPSYAISFGNNSSEWSYDGECDDPRFAGPGMADTLLDEDRGRDASDCRKLLNQGRIYVIGASSGGGINFGNNSSEWAYDGECDDPRFGGAGMADTVLDEDRGRDASDCRKLLNQGRIHVLGASSRSGISFGNNSSEWAYDGECDDPRFAGLGMADTLLDEDRGRDASDCRALYRDGSIYLR